MRNKYKVLWDIFSIGIVGLNSFILLVSKLINHNKPLIHVDISFTILYALTLLIETIVFKGKRNHKVDRTLLILKGIYILIYLTVIMISILNCFDEDGRISKAATFGYDALMFFILLLNIPTKLQFQKIVKRIEDKYGDIKSFVREIYHRLREE